MNIYLLFVYYKRYKISCMRRESGTAKIYTQREIGNLQWITSLCSAFTRLVQGWLKIFNHCCCFILLSEDWYRSNCNFYSSQFLIYGDLCEALRLSSGIIHTFDVVSLFLHISLHYLGHLIIAASICFSAMGAFPISFWDHTHFRL